MSNRIDPSDLPLGYTVEGVIGLAGGAGKVASECEVTLQTVRKWRTVPSWHAQKVAILAGLPLEIVRPSMVRRQRCEACRQQLAAA